MVLINLASQLLFALASLAIGVRLLRLFLRTRETAELGLGLAYFMGGFVAAFFRIAFVVIIQKGASADTLTWCGLGSLLFTGVGGIGLAYGCATTFRPAARWAMGVFVGVCLYVAACCGLEFFHPDGRVRFLAYFAGILSVAFANGWVAVECLLLARVLVRRAKLGLADPLVIHRTEMWGLCSLTTVVLTVTAVTSALMRDGPSTPPDPFWMALSASLGVFGSVFGWLAFFPPERLRARLQRSQAA